MIGWFVQFTAKYLYGKKCHDEVFLLLSVIATKCSHGEISLLRIVRISVRRSVCTVKCPTVKCPTAVCPTGKRRTVKIPGTFVSCYLGFFMGSTRSKPAKIFGKFSVTKCVIQRLRWKSLSDDCHSTYFVNKSVVTCSYLVDELFTLCMRTTN